MIAQAVLSGPPFDRWSKAKTRSAQERINLESHHRAQVAGTAVAQIEDGAVDQTNLEPASLVSLLDELEEWSAVLKAEPELIHKLREFEAAASGQAKDDKKDTHKNAPRRRQPRGPSL